MKRYLLDTHVLLWWYFDSSQLPNNYIKLIESAEEQNCETYISIISFWEIAKLVSLKKIGIRTSIDRWFQEIESNTTFQVLPLDTKTILESTRLGDEFHKDPADQLIVATARIHNLTLLSQDSKIIKSKTVGVV